MTNDDVDTLATALYVKTDDLLRQFPDLAPWQPAIGLQPRLSDAELVTLAVMQALLGYISEARSKTASTPASASPAAARCSTSRPDSRSHRAASISTRTIVSTVLKP